MKLSPFRVCVLASFLLLSCVDKVALTQYTHDEYSKARLTADNTVQLMIRGDVSAIYHLYNENFKNSMTLSNFIRQYDKTLTAIGSLNNAVYRDFRIGAKYYFGKIGLKRSFVFMYRTQGTPPGTILNIEIASGTNYRSLAGIFFTKATNTR